MGAFCMVAIPSYMAYNTTMTKMFSKPSIGKRLTVTTEYPKKGFAPNVTSTHTKSGVVVKSEHYDDPSSFRLATGDRNFPISVVPLDFVKGIIYEDGSKGDMKQEKIITVTAWEVKSDSRKGGSYTVTKDGNHYSCTCLGFQYRKSCRHVIKIKSEAA
jgi:hypothetical protein